MVNFKFNIGQHVEIIETDDHHHPGENGVIVDREYIDDLNENVYYLKLAPSKTVTPAWEKFLRRHVEPWDGNSIWDRL